MSDTLTRATELMKRIRQVGPGKVVLEPGLCPMSIAQALGHNKREKVSAVFMQLDGEETVGATMETSHEVQARRKWDAVARVTGREIGPDGAERASWSLFLE